MKKEYFQPEVEVITLNAADVIVTSECPIYGEGEGDI